MTHWSEADLETWQWLAGPDGADLRAAADECQPGDVSAIGRLRKQWSAEQVRIALELAEARRKAAAKFGEERAVELLADVSGIEQASSATTAEWKARRFARVPSDVRVWDLCAGIGGDAMALGMVVGPDHLTAVDLDPVRAWMAGVNADYRSDVADVAEFGSHELTGAFIHLDPARRTEGDGGGRLWRFEDYVPGPMVIARLAGAARGACVKLGPGIDVAELRDALGETGASAEVEFISEDRRLVQAVLWTGELIADGAAGRMRATMLPSGESVLGNAFSANDGANADSTEDGEQAIGEWVYEADPALERAGLLPWAMAQWDLREIHPGLGLLTGDAHVDTPWLTAFEVRDVVSGWRLKKITSALRAIFGETEWGVVDVKTRGGAVEDVDAAARALRGDAMAGKVAPITVLGLRLGDRKTVIITRRQ